MPEEKRFPVSEIYGPVIQGEGHLAGRQTLFLRLAGCDYRCSWCDTKYSVLPQLIAADPKLRQMTAQEIIDDIRRLLPVITGWELVTISGGNPCIHDITDVVYGLNDFGYAVSVETQGTITPKWLRGVKYVNISPKPPSSGMTTDFMQLAEFITSAQSWIRGYGMETIVFKVVVFDLADFQYAIDIHKRFPGIVMYLQPGTDQVDDLGACRSNIISNTIRISEWVLHDPSLSDIRVLPQIHAILYGSARGV